MKGGYYWYLIYLFYMFLISKIIYKVLSSKTMIFLAGIIILYYIAIAMESPDFITRFFYNYLFFILGYGAKKNQFFEVRKINNIQTVILGVSSFIFTLIYLKNVEALKIISAILIVAFIFEICKKIELRDVNIICRLGTYTMPVYIFDQYLIDIEEKLFSGNLILLPIFVIVNIILPILLDKFIIRKNRFLSFCFGE